MATIFGDTQSFTPPTALEIHGAGACDRSADEKIWRDSADDDPEADRIERPVRRNAGGWSGEHASKRAGGRPEVGPS